MSPFEPLGVNNAKVIIGEAVADGPPEFGGVFEFVIAVHVIMVESHEDTIFVVSDIKSWARDWIVPDPVG